TDQDPAAGEEVDAYSYVTIYYSQGKSGITIPDVTKLSVAEATRMLEGKGLNVSGTSEAYSDTVEKGKVSGTDPVVGSSVEKNSSVKLIISKGPKSNTVKVPNIVNKKLSVALEKLADLGLEAPENPSYVYSDTVKKDYVVSQTVPAATRVEVGTVVSFTVSLGPKSEATPQPTKEVSYSYEGSLRINSNPFDYEDEDPAVIKLVMEQDGKSRPVYSGTLSYNDFPKEFPIEGWSDNNGTVKLFKNDQQIGGTYNVEFKKVAK
ncbi:MAG: PASTA domain-containing protein, partial [Lachnospiraceae bacterium]|nr:PASTA domain-containing protein [Lachnospiraceae bacterium]